MDRRRTLTEEMVFMRTKCNRMDLIKNLNLWGHDLHDISVCQDMPNLEVLSLSVNRVSTLIDLCHCSKLSELYLRKNNVRDLAEVRHLKNLRNLKVLWLSDNPVATLPDYRAFVLKSLPGLTKLDEQDITRDERKVAAGLDLSYVQTRVEGDDYDDAELEDENEMQGLPVRRASGGRILPDAASEMYFEGNGAGASRPWGGDFMQYPAQHLTAAANSRRLSKEFQPQDFASPKHMRDDGRGDEIARNGHDRTNHPIEHETMQYDHRDSEREMRAADQAWQEQPRAAWATMSPTQSQVESDLRRADSSLNRSPAARSEGNGGMSRLASDGNTHGSESRRSLAHNGNRDDPFCISASPYLENGNRGTPPRAIEQTPPDPRADNILCAVLALVKELDEQGLELVRRGIEQRQREL